MKHFIVLALLASIHLSAQEFSILYLPSIPVSNSSVINPEGFQAIGGGFIFGKHPVKGIIKANYFSDLSSDVSIQDLNNLGGNLNFKRTTYEGTLFSGGVLLYPDDRFFFAAGPTYAAYTVFRETDNIAYRINFDKEFTDQFGFFAGFGFHVGKRFKLFVLYEQITGSISPGLSFSL